MSPMHTALAVAFLGALTGPLVALQQDTTPTNPIDATEAAHPVTKSTDLLGVDILDGYDGTHLGTLEDIVVDADGRLSVGLVRLAASDSPEGDALTGVPMGVLTVRISNGAAPDSGHSDSDPLDDDMRSYAGEGRQDDGLALEDDVEETTLMVCKASTLLRSAPTLSEAGEINASWLNEVKAHYGLSSASPLDPTAPASTTTTPAKATKPMLLGDFVGVDVVGQDQAEIGTLSDLALDVSTMKVRYAAVRRSSVLGFGGSLHAMPFEVGSLDLDTRELVVSLDEEGAEQLPTLTDDAPWPVAPTTPPAGGTDLDNEDRG